MDFPFNSESLLGNQDLVARAQNSRSDNSISGCPGSLKSDVPKGTVMHVIQTMRCFNDAFIVAFISLLSLMNFHLLFVFA